MGDTGDRHHLTRWIILPQSKVEAASETSQARGTSSSGGRKGRSQTIAPIEAPESGAAKRKIVPGAIWLVRTIASATGAFRTGENAHELATPTFFPSLSRCAPGSGQRRTRLEHQPAQDLIDVAERIEPRHGLLPQITTLDEIDGAGIAADLLREILLGDILAENGRARLDPQDLEHFRTRFDETQLGPGREQTVLDRPGRLEYSRSASIPAALPVIHERAGSADLPSEAFTCARSTLSGSWPRHLLTISSAAGPAR